MKILPDNTFYTEVKPEDIREIVDEHLIKGVVLTVALSRPETESISWILKMGFYKKQLRIALRFAASSTLRISTKRLAATPIRR